jgi:hypothetical protein
MLGSVTAQNEDLDACYGSGHAASWPATISLRLYSANPMAGGTELPSTGGYAAVSLTNNSTTFPNASGGQKSNGIAITFPTSTGAWGAVATYWWFTDGSGNLLDGGPLSAHVVVTVSGYSLVFPVGSIVIAVQ